MHNNADGVEYLWLQWNLTATKLNYWVMSQPVIIDKGVTITKVEFKLCCCISFSACSDMFFGNVTQKCLTSADDSSSFFDAKMPLKIVLNWLQCLKGLWAQFVLMFCFTWKIWKWSDGTTVLKMFKNICATYVFCIEENKQTCVSFIEINFFDLFVYFVKIRRCYHRKKICNVPSPKCNYLFESYT